MSRAMAESNGKAPWYNEATEIPSQQKEVKSLEKDTPDRSKTQDLERGKDSS